MGIEAKIHLSKLETELDKKQGMDFNETICYK